MGQLAQGEQNSGTEKWIILGYKNMLEKRDTDGVRLHHSPGLDIKHGLPLHWHTAHDTDRP